MARSPDVVHRPGDETGPGLAWRAFNWGAALKSGALAGLIFLVIPQGSPWASMTFASGAVMGRPVPSNVALGIVLQMVLAIGYTLLIACAARFVRSWRGIFVGGLVGLVLYFANFGIVQATLPQYSGAEVRVLVTHIVFGMFAAALYKGMTSRSRH